MEISIENTLKFLEDFKNQKIIEELEKIKAEIEEIRIQEENVDSTWCAGLKYVNNKIINKHISELKNEELKEENNKLSEPDDFHEYWDSLAN